MSRRASICKRREMMGAARWLHSTVAMSKMVTVRFLDRPGDHALVVPPRTARHLIRVHARTSHVCSLSSGPGFSLDVVEHSRHIPPDAAEIWLLPRGDRRLSPRPAAGAA
jgi:hypothetical protein